MGCSESDDSIRVELLEWDWSAWLGEKSCQTHSPRNVLHCYGTSFCGTILIFALCAQTPSTQPRTRVDGISEQQFLLRGCHITCNFSQLMLPHIFSLWKVSYHCMQSLISFFRSWIRWVRRSLSIFGLFNCGSPASFFDLECPTPSWTGSHFVSLHLGQQVATLLFWSA